MPLANNVHLLDLNGDSRMDAVYTETVGAESDVVWLFLNSHGGYQKLKLKWWGQVKQLSFREGRSAALTLLDFGCCAEYIEFETTYAFDHDLNAKPVFQRGTYFGTRRPTAGVLARPIPFSVLTDSVTLRTAPLVDDTSTVVFDIHGRGSALLKFGRGATGMIWANKTDSVGQEWHYVKMMPVKMTHGYLIYPKEEIPTRTLGWMRATDTH